MRDLDPITQSALYLLLAIAFGVIAVVAAMLCVIALPFLAIYRLAKGDLK